ncbi:MAG: transglycosylase SLT domain-containing protein [Candidatus Eremiobacteraeota bacterium]|nr:transglycosylase SLT domain-containing protein [Candidatus Eremiobacteraeota bacterium]
MSMNLSVSYGSEIAAAATRHNLDPRLLAAVAAQETGGPGADSGSNVVGDGGHGHGLFQIDDRWHAFARTPAAMNPAQNADYAAGLLSDNLDRYGGNVREALSAYNAGSPTATGTTTDWGEGHPVGYADSVMRHYERIGSLDPAEGTGSGGTAGASGAGADEADPSELIYALQTLASQLGAGTTGAGAAPYGTTGFPLQLPAYRPIQQSDGRERDLAPTADDAGDPSDS